MGKETIKIDVAVIGAGPAGYAAALTTAGAGLSTALIDSAQAGGTCLNRGCVPSKTWLAADHIARTSKWAEKLGGAAQKYDFNKIREHQKSVIELGRKGLAGAFKKKGVRLVGGNASFISGTVIEVNGGIEGGQGDKIKIEFKNAVIAAGSEPLDFFGREKGFYNSDNIFSIDKIPSSIVIVGGGAVGAEMATFFGGMGSKVTLVEMLEDILPTEDADVRSVVKREFKKSGVTVKTGCGVESASHENGACIVKLSDGAELSSEVLLTAAGRKPRTPGLGLDKAGVNLNTKGFIETDAQMRTSNENIYAAGDVAGRYLLAYTAHHEGVAAARNILGKHASMDYRFVPSMIFTNPEVGSVGKTEDELKHLGIKCRIGKFFPRALARAQAGGEISGIVKVIVGEDKSILGIHIASPCATEIIHSGVVAMAAGMKADQLAETIYGHPTLSEAIQLAAADALGDSIYS
ncbi:MAG: dihydrolipoyl dehydrogenase [Nitrospinota bacterium]